MTSIALEFHFAEQNKLYTVHSIQCTVYCTVQQFSSKSSTTLFRYIFLLRTIIAMTTSSPLAASQQTADASGDDSSYWEGLSLEVESEKKISRSDDLENPMLKSQLLYIMKSCYWGDAKTIEDCSDEQYVDNGIMLYKELKAGDAARFYYWQAYFGGNPSGYLLLSSTAAKGEGWQTLVENCDGDFIWQGPGDKRPLGFLNQVKKIAMGRYYDEEVDLITDDE